MEFERHACDILIIGSGGAAAMAALSARRQTASVTIVSKETSLVGGATIMASGGISSVFNPEDSPEVFFNDILRGGGYLNNRKLARILAECGTEAVLKVEHYGLLLDRKSRDAFNVVKKGEGHSWPRGLLDRREALGFCHGLGQALLTSGTQFLSEVLIFKLLLESDRTVGAIGLSLISGNFIVFSAKAVVLATGGLGAIYETTTNSDMLTGDGYALALEAGAALSDMEMVQFLPLAFPYPRSRRGTIIGMCSLFGPDTRLYNNRGEQYMEKYDPERKEFSTRDIVARGNFIEIMEGRGTASGAVILDPRNNDTYYRRRFEDTCPHIHKMIREVFGDGAADWKETLEAIPSQHFFMGGVQIDEDCKTAVPGLFAAGEVTGGIHGANRLSGSALTEIFVFGDRAGKRAAVYAHSQKKISSQPNSVKSGIEEAQQMFETVNKDGSRPFEVRRKIKKIMWQYFGPVRNEADMKMGIKKLQEIHETDMSALTLGSGHMRYNRERFQAIETLFMIRTALLVANAALMRRESRGSHFRTDFPYTNDNLWLKNIISKQSRDGKVAYQTKDIGDEAFLAGW
jgi:fumarate reductase (CoM/CoB) subunit A